MFDLHWPQKSYTFAETYPDMIQKSVLVRYISTTDFQFKIRRGRRKKIATVCNCGGPIHSSTIYGGIVWCNSTV